MTDLKENNLMETYKIFWEYEYKNTPVPFSKQQKTTVITKCVIERKLGNTVTTIVEGISVCRPEDNFSKKLGRKKSFERAVSLIKHNPKLRKDLWEMFKEMTPKSLTYKHK